MYYRRKILLALLQEFGGELEKISLQKLLFLFSRKQEIKSFNFVPYKYGCYSFQANADLGTLIKYELVSETSKTWKKSDDIDYLALLKPKDLSAIKQTFNEFKNFDKDKLIKLTYQSFPYYAINSNIAKNILNKEELSKVNKQRIKKTETVLFTIGYEGISLEQYLNKLIINDIHILCDVRKNSYSMKYGFSKNQLKNACEGVGIKFIHIPEVGIVSDKRKALNSQADYDKLFDNYKKTTLKTEIDKQKEILDLLKSEKRIALTCFEANIFQCHRKHLAESISKMQGFNYEIKHI
ncbi:MAG: DUF488 domain-containing protein [Bacteroidales bacterium]|nr:DUF488 domain-containing protein [Bacteroidales bacterium]